MITCNSQVPPFFGVPFLGGRKRYGSYFLSPSPSRSLRVAAREPCFAQSDGARTRTFGQDVLGYACDCECWRMPYSSVCVVEC